MAQAMLHWSVQVDSVVDVVRTICHDALQLDVLLKQNVHHTSRLNAILNFFQCIHNKINVNNNIGCGFQYFMGVIW